MTLWTLSLLPQAILLFHFLKMQINLDDAFYEPGTGVAIGKTNRKDVPAGEMMHKHMGEYSSRSGFWRTVRLQGTICSCDKSLPGGCLSVPCPPFHYSQFAKHSSGTPLFPLLPDADLSCNCSQIFPSRANPTKSRSCPE